VRATHSDPYARLRPNRPHLLMPTTYT
jgi:hypothetical protein